MKLTAIFKRNIKNSIKKMFQIFNYIKLIFIKIRIKNNTKYFCIGRNKTGTTSLKKAFEELGFVVGFQREAEFLMEDYFKDDFKRLIKYCATAEVFQDVPFSLPNTYKVLDKEFPNSKFILTVRDSSEQWYNSVTKFHSKRFGNGVLPNRLVLKEVSYVHKSWLYNNFIRKYGINDTDELYDKQKLIAHYEKHNQEILDYFKNRPQDLLVINLSNKESYTLFCDFIRVKSDKNSFPWENKTTSTN